MNELNNNDVANDSQLGSEELNNNVENNTSNVLPPKKGKSGIIIAILVILVFLLVGYIVVDKLALEKEADKKTENPTTNSTTNPTKSTPVTTEETKKDDEPTAEEIASILKKYSATNHLYDETNTEFWNITSVTYLGHYENNSETKYYIVEGTYQCKDNSNECVYVEQSMDEDTESSHAYKGGIAIKEKEAENMLPPTFGAEVRAGEVPDFVIVDQKIK